MIANAGGVNPQACAEALRKLIAAEGLDLVVATVLGDDLTPCTQEFAARNGERAIREMFSGEPFPEPARVASANAYLGAFPIAEALDRGADIVITGRCVDSAVTLGACIHAFAWQPDDFDCLAQGSLAGHILECGTQATGGNFTDWETLAETLASAGYPLASIAADGTFEVSKPAATGGAVTVGTVAEQMLYEIGDPQAYLLPDVSCDFSGVTLEQVAVDRVRVTGARGHGAPESYKVCVTWADGFRAGHIWTMVRRDARRKAELFAEGVFARTRELLREQGLPDLSETSVEISGTESHFGAAAAVSDAREVDIKIAVKHPSARGVALFLKEMTGIALAAPPGLCSFAGTRARPSPVVRLFSFLLPKAELALTVAVDGASATFTEAQVRPPEPLVPPQLPAASQDDAALVEVPLEQLAFGRSGDKGNQANIGIIARRPEYLPWLAAALTETRVADFFAHFLRPGQRRPVERFYLPGSHALNFLLHDVLAGGGVASLRTDPQGKGYAQLLLTVLVPVPAVLL
ncbi:acyclic terpene utilization AtuA family protein [Haliea sp. E1-2-M8]|nr:acyclic terpene utilization AtuA family protein [Haliea sp. E1-2-M8]MDO8863604.1 acyclic terpene utilization AtuA family protein [Haliea sp. E1-2-M8]